MAPTTTPRARIEYPWHEPYREIREAVNQLCSKFPLTYWDEHDRDGVFPEEFFRAFADGGWIGTTVPEEYGGAGLEHTAMAAVFEEVASGGGALDACSAVHIATLALPVLLRHATEEQKQRFVPPIVAGELYCTFGVTEPNAGTDTTRIETVAEERDGRWVINGQKVWNSGALRGDRVLLVARNEKRSAERPAKGMTLFMADLGHPGVTIKSIPKFSRNAVASAELFLENVEVEPHDLIGEVGEGFYHLLAGLNGERLTLASEALGIGRWTLDQASRYARERVVFGSPIGRNQSIQHPLADAYMHLLAASEIVARALAAFDGDADPREVGRLANAAKYLATEASFKATDHAMQVFGGFSYAREYHIGRHWAHSRLQKIAPVSNQLVLNYIGEQVLGLPRSY